MRAYTFKEFIGCPPQRVWDALTDLPNSSRWRPLVKTMETEDGAPLRPGSRVRLVVEFAGQTISRVSETVAFEPPYRWALRSGDRPEMEGLFDFRLEQQGPGTLITATCDLIAHGFLPWLFIALVAAGERSRRIEMLPNLKRYMEGVRC